MTPTFKKGFCLSSPPLELSWTHEGDQKIALIEPTAKGTCMQCGRPWSSHKNQQTHTS
jgi:hypothetical protein